ncbi:MAG: tRNA (guanosine(46)-N7)-methyltransferase TrmB [Dysgonamonadaceae bacterium]|jgi:tRNA (guanine-N7-)-methyltransferase|nr:tRNA (guanosine(46)-N7)-methyltransferase TrmB [Dysgonamonadaceae bacterium]
MGKNKLRKFAEINDFQNVFQYPFSLLQDKGFEYKGLWNNSIFKNDNPIVLELGCGKGEYTVGLGKLFPNKNFIGLDIKGARIWSGAKQALTDKMTNVAFIRSHIELLEYFFTRGEVREIWLTFPDPQMNKVNKRMTSTRLLSLYNKVLCDNGIIHLKTDSPFLYEYSRELVKLNDFKILRDTDDLYNGDYSDAIVSIKTFYEQQWLSRGKTIKLLEFELANRNQYLEPQIDIEKDDYRSFGRKR